jgi:glycine hydroxymethyltransferase
MEVDFLRSMPDEVKKVVDLVQKHNRWRGHETINMIASENVTSPLVDMVYMSDAMHRYAEGLPYKRFYQGLIYIDEIEVYANQIMSELFNAKYVDLRPISGTIANATAFYVLGTRGGKALVTPRVPRTKNAVAFSIGPGSWSK